MIAHAAAKGTREGAVHAATQLDGVTSTMRTYSGQSFGPVKSITRVKDMDEAVAVANATEYGLPVAVFTRDITRAFEVANRMQSGTRHINGPTVTDEPQTPLGGNKASGDGRFRRQCRTGGIHRATLDCRWEPETGLSVLIFPVPAMAGAAQAEDRKPCVGSATHHLGRRKLRNTCQQFRNQSQCSPKYFGKSY
nr:aldehyde dehydrogenase family protein [Mangrovicoccus sp. HB161399]